MPKKLITFLLLSAVIAGSVYIYQRPSYPVLSDDLVFQRIDGTRQTLKEIKGKPLLVTFWSPTCKICMQEVSHLNLLYSDLRGGKDFELLALSMYYDRPDWVVQSSTDKNMKYPVYFDLKNSLSQAFGNIVATPTSFLLNSGGKIIYRQVGKLDIPIVQQKLIELMG